MNTIRLLCFLLIASLSQLSHADELSAQKRADIEHLLQVTNALDIGRQFGGGVIAQINQMIRKLRPDIPQKVLDTLPSEVNAVLVEQQDDLKELIVLVYHEHFTREDIRGMIDFYSTDLGKKTIAVMPTLMGQSMQAGQVWGQSIAPLIDERIKARLSREGYEI